MSERLKMSGCFLGGPLLADQLFMGLSESALQELASLRRRKLLKEGVAIISTGAHSMNVCILCSGSAALYVQTHEGRKILRQIASNEIMGVPEAISDASFEYEIVTTSPASIDVIKKNDFIDFINKHKELCFKLLENLGTNLQRSYSMFSEHPGPPHKGT